jgi:two-component system, NtrC family, sensor kinase
MPKAKREIALWLFLDKLRTYLRSTREYQRALSLAVRWTCDHFNADQAAVAVLAADGSTAEIIFGSPRRATWDLDCMATFLHQQRANIPANVIMAPMDRRTRLWSALALRREHPFQHPEDHHALRRVAKVISESIDVLDWRRAAEVRSQIDRKILEQLRPQDLFYQILHGLRSLTQYDHSSALLISDQSQNELELVAEQVAWRKGKSQRIGMKLPLNDELRALLQKNTLCGFDRHGDEWRGWLAKEFSRIAALLDYNRGAETPSGDVRESAMLCAPLVTRDGVLGVIKVAGRYPGLFGEYEASLVQRFVPVAAIAIQNSQRNVTLQTKMVEAERKHILANLVRGVSHDVNNALGNVLPLIQQMQADVNSGRVQVITFSEDLEQIEKSIQVCRRIFGGMLAMAHDADQASPHGNVRRALDSTLAILRDRLDRQGICLEMQLAEILPNIQVGQADLEQLLLNLASNAGDSMPKGGTLSIGIENLGAQVAIVIRDTGMGIPPENMARIQEPFFTTKHNGHGLGLSICRSIISNVHGEVEFKSTPEVGTQVKLWLPVIPDRSEG